MLYRVWLTRDTTESFPTEIEAASEEEAKRKLMGLHEQGELSYNWELDESTNGDEYISDCTELGDDD